MAVVLGSTADYRYACNGASQRNLPLTSNNILWAAFTTAGGTTTDVQFRYSTDGGVTWTDPGAGSHFGFASTAFGGIPLLSFYIDQDDYAHVVYKDQADKFIYYRRGTPNAGRTAWTWTTAYLIDNGTTWVSMPDCVAHREGTGWKVHITWSSDASSLTDHVGYTRLDITSSGVITTEVDKQTIGLASYGVDGYKVSSIDFHHSGDGKTLNGNPDLYLVLNTQTSGAGLGVLLFKATYSAGTWTWGSPVEVDNNLKQTATNQFQQLIFDGTRVLIGGYYSGPATTLAVWSVDPNTLAVTRLLYQENALSGNNNSANSGAMGCDADGNIYIVGVQSSSNPSGVQRLVYYQLEPGNLSCPPPVVIQSPASNSDLWPKVQRSRPGHEMAVLWPTGGYPSDVNFASFNARTRQTINTVVERDYVPAGPPTFIPINTVVEDDTAPVLSGSRYRYTLETPTFPVAVTRGEARYHLDQAVSVVKIDGHYRTVHTPTPEQLQAAGTEGIDWFIGGHIYDNIRYQVAQDLTADGFTTTPH